ncbi:MAG: hypothetical protein R3F61_05905 [Myxococcota bacterium]
MLWFALAHASSGPLLAPAAPESDGFITFSGAAQLTRQGETYRFASDLQRSFGRHVVGTHIAAMEQHERDVETGVFSLAVHYGFRAVDHRRVVVMPFLNVGGFVQPGIAARAHLPVGPARIGVDASVGYAWELPVPRRVGVDVDDRLTTYGVKPEAGIWVDLGGPVCPTGRLGVIGTDLVASAQIGQNLFARAALVVDPLDPEPAAWVSVGLRMGARSEVHPGPWL